MIVSHRSQGSSYVETCQPVSLDTTIRYLVRGHLVHPASRPRIAESVDHYAIDVGLRLVGALYAPPRPVALEECCLHDVLRVDDGAAQQDYGAHQRRAPRGDVLREVHMPPVATPYDRRDPQGGSLMSGRNVRSCWD